ncbi:MAG: type I restriction-modification system subunit M N-terminal domain-containing protein, partial [Bacteroidales bacterium]|nr:type I restriction-modification system subunit M N-terminal domain-containing protein [Bacteroidales bacterium]
MNQEQHSNIVSFIWNIANILVNNYNKGDYRKIIMPFMVLRRLDAVLEGKKDELKMALETADSLFPDKAEYVSQR